MAKKFEEEVMRIIYNDLFGKEKTSSDSKIRAAYKFRKRKII